MFLLCGGTTSQGNKEPVTCCIVGAGGEHERKMMLMVPGLGNGMITVIIRINAAAFI